MDNANLPQEPETQLDLLSELKGRLAAAEVLPDDPESRYQEPVNDHGESAGWLYSSSNEHTFGKLEQHVQPEPGTAALAVGSTQGYQLLGMYPNLAALHVVDNSDAAVATARAIPELVLRIRQLTGRMPTAAQIIDVLSDRGSFEYGDDGPRLHTPPLAQRILELPPAVPGQRHTFSPDELRAISSNTGEIADDLRRQLGSNWLQPEQLERIAEMYRSGHIQIHRGSIFGGKVMDHLQHQKPPFGIVYTSNVIQGAGYGALYKLEEISQAFGQLPCSANAFFVQAVGNVVGPDRKYWRSHGHEDWAYLALRGLPSFLEYLRPNNPDIESARYSSSMITIMHYPGWSGRPLSLSQDGVIVEHPQPQAADE